MKKAKNILGYMVLDEGLPCRDSGLDKDPEYRFINWIASHYPVAVFEDRATAQSVKKILYRRYARLAKLDELMFLRWNKRCTSLRITAIQQVLIAKDELRRPRPASIVAVVVMMMALFTPAAHAQHRVDFALYAADATIRTLDITSTHALLASPCRCFHEDDPLSPGGRALGPLVAFQYGVSASVIAGSRRLSARGHRRVARAGLLVDIAVESFTVQRNMRRHELPAVHGTGFVQIPEGAR